MTDAEWLTSSDPRPMLRYLIGTKKLRVQAVERFPEARVSDRKLRLFACAATTAPATFRLIPLPAPQCRLPSRSRAGERARTALACFGRGGANHPARDTCGARFGRRPVSAGASEGCLVRGGAHAP